MDRIKNLMEIEILIKAAKGDVLHGNIIDADAILNNALQIIALMIEEEKEN